MNKAVLNIDELSTEERLDLLDRLWESLRKDPSSVPLTDAQRAELDRRLEDLEGDIAKGVELGVPWEEVLRQIRSRSR